MDPRPNAARIAGALVTLFVVAACTDRGTSPVAPVDPSAPFENAVSQQEVLTHAIIHRTVEGQEQARAGGLASTTSDLFYHGGTGGICVHAAPKVVLVLWDPQWSNDPSGSSA